MYLMTNLLQTCDRIVLFDAQHVTRSSLLLNIKWYICQVKICLVVSYLISTCCPPFSTILACLSTVCKYFSTYCPSILKYHSTYCLQNYGLRGTPSSKYMWSAPRPPPLSPPGWVDRWTALGDWGKKREPFRGDEGLDSSITAAIAGGGGGGKGVGRERERERERERNWRMGHGRDQRSCLVGSREDTIIPLFLTFSSAVNWGRGFALSPNFLLFSTIYSFISAG